MLTRKRFGKSLQSSGKGKNLFGEAKKVKAGNCVWEGD